MGQRARQASAPRGVTDRPGRCRTERDELGSLLEKTGVTLSVCCSALTGAWSQASNAAFCGVAPSQERFPSASNSLTHSYFSPEPSSAPNTLPRLAPVSERTGGFLLGREDERSSSVFVTCGVISGIALAFLPLPSRTFA